VNGGMKGLMNNKRSFTLSILLSASVYMCTLNVKVVHRTQYFMMIKFRCLFYFALLSL
jgi:hypothetical protein